MGIEDEINRQAQEADAVKRRHDRAAAEVDAAARLARVELDRVARETSDLLSRTGPRPRKIRNFGDDYIGWWAGTDVQGDYRITTTGILLTKWTETEFRGDSTDPKDRIRPAGGYNSRPPWRWKPAKAGQWGAAELHVTRGVLRPRTHLWEQRLGFFIHDEVLQIYRPDGESGHSEPFVPELARMVRSLS